jgi:hypothetical protein
MFEKLGVDSVSPTWLQMMTIHFTSERKDSLVAENNFVQKTTILIKTVKNNGT